ncbi:cytochrome P450 2G1 [Trichonephila clavipes]|nr:cytochrome P450 2G1 [Trichonephila clavipes]
MYDNAQPHRSIEDALGKRVAKRTILPRTLQELEIAPRQQWDNIPQGLDSLVKNMENRHKMCISVHGTGALSGLPWKEQKRFSVHMLRDLGFGKTRMEGHIKEEILELLERMSEHVGKPTKLSYLLVPSMSNNIASLVFGKRLKYDDPERQDLDRLLKEISILAGSLTLLAFFPSIKRIVDYFNIGNKGRLVRVSREVTDYCRNQIKKHEETLDPNNIRDFS